MKGLLVLFSALSVLAILRVYFFFESKPEYREGDRFSKTHTFFQEPVRRGLYQVFWVSNVQVYASAYPAYHYGDIIHIEGTVEKRSYISQNSGSKNSYSIVQKPTLSQDSNRNIVLEMIGKMRLKIIDTYLSALQYPESSILLGIVMGIQNEISKELYSELISSGLLHIVVASGSNISIITAFLIGILSVFIGRKTAIISAIVTVIFYSFIVGLEPAIVRATLMSSFAFIGGLFGRQAYSLLNLVLAALIMLIASPYLVEDIGFYLSFFSTFGIIEIKPLLDSYIFRNKILSADLSTTLAAQLATVPLIIVFFHSISVFSVLSNILVLWMVPILMVIGGVGALVSLFSEILARAFLLLAYPFLSLFHTIVVLFSRLSKPIALDTVSLNFAIGYYLFLLAGILLIKSRRQKK